MNSTELLLNCITKKYFQFQGRASRKEFLLFTVCAISFGAILDVSLFVFASKFWLYKVMFFISSIYSIFITIPSFAVNVRRLHDMNLSGWWLFIFAFIIPILAIIALSIFGEPFKDRELSIPFYFLLLFLITMSIKGNSGSNKYGEEPIN